MPFFSRSLLPGFQASQREWRSRSSCLLPWSRGVDHCILIFPFKAPATSTTPYWRFTGIAPIGHDINYPTPRSVPVLLLLAPCHQFFSGRVHRTVAQAEGHGQPVMGWRGSDWDNIDRRRICRGHRRWELELLDECRPCKPLESPVSAFMIRHPFYHRRVFTSFYLHPMAIPLS